MLTFDLSSFEDIACLGGCQALVDLSVDGNPLASMSPNHRLFLLSHVPHLHTLSQKGITVRTLPSYAPILSAAIRGLRTKLKVLSVQEFNSSASLAGGRERGGQKDHPSRGVASREGEPEGPTDGKFCG